MLKKKDPRAARKAFQEALQTFHGYAPAWKELALLEKQEGTLEEAGRLMNKALEANPFYAEAASELGKIYMAQKKENLAQLARAVGLLGSIVRDLSPFDFKPANPAYPEIARRVQGIFDKAAFRKIPVQVRIEAADALAQTGDPRLERIEWVKIPGGRFWMGAQKRDPKAQNYDSNAYEGEWTESPVHQVELSPFEISKYPINFLLF